MKLTVLVIAFALIPMMMSVRARGRMAPEDLTTQINGILHDKSLSKAQVGVQIVRLGENAQTSKVIYRSNSDVPLTPASNLKLITTSAALDRLGADFKFKTELVYHDGELILIGDGDPAFGDAELLTRVGWDVTTVFQNWASRVKQAKLGPIKGVVVDDSIFDEIFFHPDWPANQRLERYEAEISGMLLNINCLDVFIRPTKPGEPVSYQTNPPTHYTSIKNQCVTGEGLPALTRAVDSNEMTLSGKSLRANDEPLSITVHDGAMYAATVLGETLASAHVDCPQPPRRDRRLRAEMQSDIASGDRSWQVIGVHETPLPQVMNRANKDSMNLYAECLCKRLGAQATGEPGSWQNGTAAAGEFLTKIGVEPNAFRLDDGCGLSKQNHITAGAITKVLVHDYFSPDSKLFIASLSVAGSDGTLKSRFAGSSLRGRVFAKTGTVDGVSCLSGYVNARDGNCYAFSILINNCFSGAGKPTQEKIVEAIDNKS